MLNSGKPTPYIVGLTGGIGCGKSTIGQLFAELGVEIIDADAISHAIVSKGEPSLDTIAARLGKTILDNNGELNRAELKKIIFNNEAEKRWLENLLHPVIRATIETRILASKAPYVILMVPLLLESGHYNYVDRILVVDVSESIQIARIRHRDNMPVELIRKIIATQLPREERLNRTDDIIFNEASVDEVRDSVQQLHEQYLQYGAQKTNA